MHVRHPQVQFVSHMFAIFPILQAQIYVLTWLHSLKQAGVFVCCNQLQEYADRVWNSREACLNSQFTTTGPKTVKRSRILKCIFLICCFHDSSSIQKHSFVSIWNKYVAIEDRFAENRRGKTKKYQKIKQLFVGLNNRETWEVCKKEGRGERQLPNDNSVKPAKLCDVSKKWYHLQLLLPHSFCSPINLSDCTQFIECIAALVCGSFTRRPSPACTHQWFIGHYFYRGKTMHVKILRALK